MTKAISVEAKMPVRKSRMIVNSATIIMIIPTKASPPRIFDTTSPTMLDSGIALTAIQ